MLKFTKTAISTGILLILIAAVPRGLPAAANHLPLAVGNQWQLRSAQGGTLSYEVVASDRGEYRVNWQNPWIPGMQYQFATVGNSVNVTAMNAGGGLFDLPAGTKFFDFAAPLNASWTNLLGTFTVTGRSLTVTTPAGAYSNCIRIRQRSTEGVVFDWSFAPNVGFIQFGLDSAAYRLSAPARLVAETAPSTPVVLPPVPKGHRILGLDANMAGDGDYIKAITHAKAAGAQAVSMTVFWETIESGANRWNGSLFNDANAFYSAYGLSLDLSLTAMDTVGKHVPADLAGLPMNHPVVIDRYRKYIDYVFTRIPALTLNYVLIGAEVDLGLKSPAEWAEFESFVAAVAPHIRSKRPGVRVGVSSTFGGLVGPNQAALKRMNKDAIFVSYYPVNAYSEVRDPSTVAADFDKLAQQFAGYKLIFEQIGYPSSSANNSSTTKQSDFIKAVFQSWDRYATQILTMNFAWLTDLSDQQVALYRQYYGMSDTKFLELLRTLGLRTWDGAGTSKPAYTTFVNEAKARGW